MTATTREALVRDVHRRIGAVQRLMEEQGLKVLVGVIAGAPGRTGWMRYFAAGDARVSQAYIVIEPHRIDPLIVVSTPRAAEWIRSMATTTRVESTSERGIKPVDRVVEIVAAATGGSGRAGILGLNDALFASDHLIFREALPALELVDLTDSVNAIRQIKSPFEIAAMQEMGRVLAEALDLFAARARPGRLLVEVAGEVEGFLQGQGCIAGRVKYSLGERPYTIPPLPGQRFRRDDVFVFQFVYLSALGYWYELSSLYSFLPLPAETARRLRAMEQAMQQTARLAVPGTTYGEISAMADHVFTEHGFTVIGKHTEDCHTIGTDIRDGANITPEGWVLKENMVLALHPASLMEGDVGFFLIDNFLVTPKGAVPLSPLQSFYRQLDIE